MRNDEIDNSSSSDRNHKNELEEQQRLRSLLDRILWQKVSNEARQRINRLRLVYPKRALDLEMKLVQLLQQNPQRTFQDDDILKLLQDMQQGDS